MMLLYNYCFLMEVFSDRGKQVIVMNKFEIVKLKMY